MNVFLLKEYLGYWLYQTNEYSLHSPFLYRLYTEVITPDWVPEDVHKIESIRKEMLQNTTKIQTNSLGAPSSISNGTQREIRSIANGGITLPKYSSLLFRLIQWKKSSNVWELGTSLGINTLYLSANRLSKITTFEGCTSTLDVATSNFNRLGRRNITTVEGDIAEQLPRELSRTSTLDFVFFDANHRLEPTLAYFDACSKKVNDKSIFVFDDIHWSKDMKRAWKRIKKDPAVATTVDLFQVGLVFFDHSLTKEHVVLSY